jgi:N utilization substance protein A
VQRVSIVDDRERVVEVIVEDKQLSLAIGKKGQNVRLAAKLTGWRIDIKSEEEKRREIEAQLEGFDAALSREEGAGADAGAEAAATGEQPAFALPGLSEKTMRKLIEAGFSTPEKIAEATVDALSEVQGIGLKTAERIIAAARGEHVDEAETESKSE